MNEYGALVEWRKRNQLPKRRDFIFPDDGQSPDAN
jgi:hypothetical protein